MKHIAHVLTFAAALAALAPAQTPQDPQQELATVIAVEEQERDLAKAEQAYRAAIAGGKVSAEAKRLAQQRLAALLQKLGRNEEAAALRKQAGEGAVAGLDDVTAPQGQDAAREAELREKAKVLVQQVIEDRNRTMDLAGLLLGMRQATAEQMLWIGQAGVPVVIAALEGIAKADQYDPNVVAALGGFLWRVGGPQAAEFLTQWAKQGTPGMRANVVRAAYQANRPEMLATAEAFLDDPDPQITFAMLQWRGQNEGPLEWRFDLGVLLAMAERGGPERKAFVLDWATRYTVKDPAEARRIVALARAGFASTDPAVGAAARKCLQSQSVQACVDGIEFLLAEAPRLGGEIKLQFYGAPGDAGRKEANDRVSVSPDVVRRLWPQVFACLQALGADRAHRNWVLGVANWVLPEMGSEVVPDLLALVDAGDEGLVDYLWHRVTPENVAEVMGHYERFGDWKARERFLLNLRLRTDPPASLLPRLRELAEKQRSETPGEDLAAFARLMARTGNPEAADWITAEWQRRTDDPKWAVQPLLLLGRRTQDEKVRAAMRTLLASERLGASGGDLLLALLSMHDLPTLESEQSMGRLGWKNEHPYAEGKGSTRVADYLFGRNPQPPHGFTEDELAGLLGRLATAKLLGSVFSWQEFDKLTPRLHGEVVRLQLLATPQRVPGGPIELGANSPNSVRGMLASTVLQRARTEEGRQSSLREWAATMLREPRADVREAVLAHLEKAELEPHRALVETFVDGDDESLAICAARMLGATSVPLDPAKLAKNRYPGVRQLAVKQWGASGKTGGEAFLLPLLRDTDAGVRMEAAEFFGARVSKEAVPDLIALLRDPKETVRKEAADALTRIRFFHEQQAHWDRVMKGLDASSTSAVEKLLLQAKPGAPREQRLLAITSLGTLGVPEALPFLIDWTTDPDAELAAAAKASITQIHLNPKR